MLRREKSIVEVPLVNVRAGDMGSSGLATSILVGACLVLAYHPFPLIYSERLPVPDRESSGGKPLIFNHDPHSFRRILL